MAGHFQKGSGMQVAVVGAGVIGVCTAYFLAEAGHEVVVIERRNNVAEEASFGDAGMLAYGSAAPSAIPGWRRFLRPYLKKKKWRLFFDRTLVGSWGRWISQWRKESDIGRYQANHTRMQRVAGYSREVMTYLRDRHQFDYEQTNGSLQLLRTERDVQLMQPVLNFMTEHGIRHSVLDALAAREVEPALNTNTPLAAALHFPDDESGNCPLFARQMRHQAQAIGVEFHFGSEVTSIKQRDRGVVLHIDGGEFNADAVVLATGADSAKLLTPLG
jgi:D-amino-acid dehydrogenase